MTFYADLTRTAAQRGHAPAVVFRDATTGERTELSWATLHNWVSKTANLLLDRVEGGMGSVVVVDLPLHWMAPVICLGAWATGAAVAVGGGGDVHVGFEGEATEPDLLVGAGMAGRPLGAEAGDALTVDDVLAEPDEFVDDPGDDGAWAIGGRTQATLTAERIDPGTGVRLLHAGDRVEEETAFLIARALPAGTSIVLARGFDAPGLAGVATEERIG